MRGMRVPAAALALILTAILTPGATAGLAPDAPGFDDAQARAVRFDRAVGAADRVLRAWLRHADPKTLLLPDRVPGPGSGLRPGQARREYTPHNSGADLYPYLILTAHLTDPDLVDGRLLEMLRNEVRYTNAPGTRVPGSLNLDTGAPGPPSLFGAGEYAKDGLVTVTEYLGRTPWFARMVGMVADAMERASVHSRFGMLPAADSELNGDYLQVLPRLALMTGDRRFLEWARRIGDAYVEEVLPGNHGVPSSEWDFATHTGKPRLRLRDHGNELVVGLVLQYALEHDLGTERAARWRPVIGRMLDRILASANPDGLLYDEVDAATLAPVSPRLSDNWGYVYGAIYTFYQVTGEERYREAVRRVLGNLPKYRRHAWEPRNDPAMPLGSFDGYADTIESAIYLVNREPVAGALDWIQSEMSVMLDMQRPDGHIEYWYGEGNFNRTALLYALMQSRGARPARWQPGVGIGAVPHGSGIALHVTGPGPLRVQFDYARHRRELNLPANVVRLNEFPEWFVVDETALYRLSRPGDAESDVRLGAELVSGVDLTPGDWIVEKM
jgi:hypothetical protein